ncbi:hypothetical protein [Paractinoplanes deccanensis]|nr:hypothetical protein [Actinoplanes deccanensis]
MTSQTHVVAAAPAEPPPTPASSDDRLRLGRPGLAAATVAGLAAVASSLWSGMNADVTYALGGIETAGRGGVSVFDVFVARPLAYRLLMWLVELPVGDDAPIRVAHLLTRLSASLLVVAVTVVLFLGLRRFLDSRAAGFIAAATGLSLVIAPPWHFLEPDWVAVLAVALAVGAACAPRRVWLGAVLGGFCVLLTVAVKLATAPLALLALIMVAVLNWRRAAWATAAAAALTVVWYVATKALLPWENIWLGDQAALVVDSPIHHGVRWEDIYRLLRGIGDVALLSPLVAVAPAAAAVLVRRLRPGRPRWIGTGVAVAAAGLSVAPAYGQGEFFMYHFAPVPVLAAAVCAAAFALCPGARTPLLAVTTVFVVASFVLLRQSPQWRLDHVIAVTMTYAVVALIAAVAAWHLDGRRLRAVPAAAMAVVLIAGMVLATLPRAPYAFSGYNQEVLNDKPSAPGYAELRERIGPDTPVMYFSFASVNYDLGNPTACRYPSPQWLQRAAKPGNPSAGFRSYADNLKCLTEDTKSRYLIWQWQWFSIATSSEEVKALVAKRFDCSLKARIPGPRELVVCPTHRWIK